MFSGLTSNENSPFTLVVVPLRPPFSEIVAPIMGSPVASVTLPDMALRPVLAVAVDVVVVKVI